MRDLNGKTAVITGAGSGIGRAMAMAFAGEGMNIVLSGTHQERLQAAAAAVAEIGVRATVITCDVADRKAVQAMADQAFAEYGAVHLLCNNAGVTTTGPFLDHTDADWDWVYAVVLKGVVHGIQAFYPRMVKQGGGHILNTGSQAGLAPDWRLFHGPYTSAKAAVTALTTALRAEAEVHNVGVSLLIPAGTRTEILASGRSRQNAFGGAVDQPSVVPSPRPGTPSALPGTRMLIEPEEVAARAVAGVKENKPFIATHPGLRPVVEDYFRRILAAYE